MTTEQFYRQLNYVMRAAIAGNLSEEAAIYYLGIMNNEGQETDKSDNDTKETNAEGTKAGG